MVDFTKVGNFIIKALQVELIEQGHKATGNLVNSFEQRFLELPNSLVLEILMDDYGKYVDSGRRKGFIDFVIENKLDFVYTELEKQVFEEYDASIATIVKDFNKSK